MAALKKGLITEEQITRSCVRLYTTRFLLGLFDGSEYDSIPYEVVECEGHRKLAVTAAEKGIVLLKNDGILPLDKSRIKTIGVIGPNANSRRVLSGNYHGTSSHYVTGFWMESKRKQEKPAEFCIQKAAICIRIRPSL